MGVPVLATAVGGPSETISDGVDGLLLEPRDPGTWAARAIGLLANPARCAAMGASGRQTAQRFGRAILAQKLLALYAALQRVNQA